MTLLQVMPDTDPMRTLLRTSEPATIADHLDALGVEFARRALVPVQPDADSERILASYRDDVDKLAADRGFQFVDVAVVRPDDSDPDWPERAATARGRFLSEHAHDEDEVRFFVSGRGCFYLHIDGNVHAVVCTAGDLLSVPRGTRHWFDMGPRPDFAAIRFFEHEDGWVARFAPDSIAAGFPSLDDLIAAQP
jgi:1,2-dihydroxy-3-keto-5-methylthiopentene dioxygenase